MQSDMQHNMHSNISNGQNYHRVSIIGHISQDLTERQSISLSVRNSSLYMCSWFDISDSNNSISNFSSMVKVFLRSKRLAPGLEGGSIEFHVFENWNYYRNCPFSYSSRLWNKYSTEEKIKWYSYNRLDLINGDWNLIES